MISNSLFLSIRQLFLVGELSLTRALLVFGIVIIPYYNTQWPNGGWTAAAILIFSGCLLNLLLTGEIGERIGNSLSALVKQLRLLKIIFFGVICQIVIALITDPILVSDQRTYLNLTKRLVEGMNYMDEAGHLAFWPPGLPFFLAPFVAVFGAGAKAIMVANIFLYLIGVTAAWNLGRKIFNAQNGVLAAFLFTLWPNRLLSAGLASKENLTVAMILAGTTLCVATFESVGRKSWLFAIWAGTCFGLAALAQPGFLLLVAAVPIIYRGALRHRLLPFLSRCIVIIGCTVMCLAPWHIRNCIVFDGEFCGLSTNGGSVFYRANNPKATGLFIEEGEVHITKLPELEQNRIGFELGKKWIRENPEEFLKLAVKKLSHFFGDDNYGASFAILRGTGVDYENALKNSSLERLWSYRITTCVSLLFWVLILAWSARALTSKCQTTQLSHSERLLPLIYPLIYSAAVFSIFESGSRQHTVAQGILLVLASSSLIDPKKNVGNIEP